MNQGLAVVIGLSIAYLASFAGMIFAYLYYKKHQDKRAPQSPSPERREA